MTVFSLKDRRINLYDAKDVNVKNVGILNGSASFGLSETDDVGATVFDIQQMNANNTASLKMAGGNDNNTRFSGYNIYAKFDSDSASFYNVEIDTANSIFDFTKTDSGAMISTTGRSCNNEVYLGGGRNPIDGEMIAADRSYSEAQELRYYNNVVMDSGSSNAFISSADSATKFITTYNSRGAFIMGGDISDTYYLDGINATVVGGGGYNIFNNGVDSEYNAIFGGYGVNVYNDYGTRNMYQGFYALNEDKYNGVDIIRLNGNYGVARADAENAVDDPNIFYGGSNNVAFTSDYGESLNGTGISYKDLMKGAYAEYNYKDGMRWTLSDFYSNSTSPTGKAREYSSYFLSRVIE